MTSNLGSEYLVEEDNVDKARDKVMSVVRKSFRPEFLNRIDEILMFRRLSRDMMVHIVDIQLAGLLKMLEERNMSLVLDDKAREYLAEIGYDPAYGARPLKRVIQKELQNPLANMIIEGKLIDGQSVDVTAGKGGLIMKATDAKTKPKKGEAA